MPETIQVNPADQIRTQLRAHIMGAEFNGAKISTGLDKLQTLLAQQKVPPAAIFAELATTTELALEKARVVGDVDYTEAFVVKAESYRRTTEIFPEEVSSMQPAVEIVPGPESPPAAANKRGRRPNVQKPSNTSSLPPMTGAKR